MTPIQEAAKRYLSDQKYRDEINRKARDGKAALAMISTARQIELGEARPDFFQQAGRDFNRSPSFRDVITERAEKGDKIAICNINSAIALSAKKSAQH
ncbi:protein of unknown function [Acidithiobacillus ferrivorans]|uniref:Uncharacterized protein n=1 Tax=Acidithiobacillus ferrivorans TaxID=160808 RepID=A0A060UPT4_9PROT|nr:hypothetical protein [Acidithiobacillus ferrivorans]CDQ10622.1 hypothetical protein AFERRI_400403 [Acidithiobacillus ferrivorans]SMH64652.1 protein of unknown function [Acidithiobacillus ferrivorans]